MAGARAASAAASAALGVYTITPTYGTLRAIDQMPEPESAMAERQRRVIDA